MPSSAFNNLLSKETFFIHSVLVIEFSFAVLLIPSYQSLPYMPVHLRTYNMTLLQMHLEKTESKL